MSQSENVELTDRDKEIIQRLKDWDLWGPLLVCLALAVLLSFKAPVGRYLLFYTISFHESCLLPPSPYNNLLCMLLTFPSLV